MNTFRKELWFDIPKRMGFVNITRDVDACLKESGIREGLCLSNSFPDDLHQHSLPSPSVEFSVKYLLPRTKIQLPIGDGYNGFPSHD